MTNLIAKFKFFNQINPGKKNMLVKLPIWIIKHEKNLFLCISEPSAFYRHFVRPYFYLQFFFQKEEDIRKIYRI